MDYLSERIANILMDYITSLDNIKDVDVAQIKYLIENTQDEFDMSADYE